MARIVSLSIVAACIVSCSSTIERIDAGTVVIDADADADADADVCAASMSSPSAASQVQGLYHMTEPEPGDAFNVLIDHVSGTFIYAVNGCDYFHTSRGRFEERGSRLFLLPQHDQDTFYWPAGGSYARTLMEAEVIAEGQGIRVETGEESQHWVQGGLCSGCGSSPDAPCDDPYFGDECD